MSLYTGNVEWTTVISIHRYSEKKSHQVRMNMNWELTQILKYYYNTCLTTCRKTSTRLISILSTLKYDQYHARSNK